MTSSKRSSTLLAVVAAFMVLGLMSAADGFASSPHPPFSQCPSVGASSSCKVLLVVNVDRSVTVYDDPAIGDYDGGDDTLVGIWNQSASPVDAVTVTGTGSSLALLDGDGLCTFGVVGCPFGPTGYEGPGTSIVTEPSLPDSAEIDFTGGLPAGATGYFSLEGTLTSAQLTARQGHLGGYVALGDSYSAGEGTGDYGYGTGTSNNHCDRSPHAYGPLLDSDRHLGSISFVACSGAITADLMAGNHEGNPEPAQFSALTTGTSAVTMTIGGNDVGFAELGRACMFGRISFTGPFHGHSGCAHESHVTNTVQNRINALAGVGSATTPGGVSIHSILSLLLAIHQDAPSARIFVAGYPQLFGSFKGECGVGTLHLLPSPVSAAVKITADDAQFLNSVASRLDNAISNAVATARVIAGANVTFVDPNGNFSGHRLCEGSSSWIKPFEGSEFSIDPGSFHPTIDGQQQGYEAAFLGTNIGE